MDILAGLKEKLRLIEKFYEASSAPFRETMRKIDQGEPPFAPPYFDPEGYGSDEPPFLEEWQEADDGLNIIGQAALSLIQSALREYLDGFIFVSKEKNPAGTGNWFRRYQAFFLETYGIDWESGPMSPAQIEEINFARNDIQHSGQEFGMTRRQNKEHSRRFPEGIFIHEIDKAIARESAMEWQSRIYVTQENLQEAVQRVERFCEFLDGKRQF